MDEEELANESDPVLLLLPFVGLALQLILCTIKFRQSRLDPEAVIEGM